ncbi:MAG: diadenylate cyclase CdaA [Deltaproteobacteria bacterium]|jgi:diadenylate cyclase|nr:diadenylate cyclase CdaA [Deltaproteobacteria bacterium]
MSLVEWKDKILDLALGMKLEDYIDVILVAIVFYLLIVLIRRTRSVQVLVGIGFLWLAYLLAQDKGVKTLSLLVSKTLDSNLLLAVVVLFTPDIRRGLARLGRLPFFKADPRATEAVKDVVRACFFMAEKRTGALIAFERHVTLNEYVELGVKMGSHISDRLLLAVFNTHAPLHDGAVIIQNGLLAAAGCLLPLTPGEDNVSRFFGTRHRAAIGLSRESDAIVIVVSEERGLVSLVRDGEVEVMMGAASLQDKLLVHMGLKKKKDKSVRGGQSR